MTICVADYTSQVYKKHEKIEKVTGSRDDVFVGVLTKNIPK